MLQLVPLAAVEPAAVEALLDRAFGTDRHRRTAYAVRGAARPIAALSFGAIAAETLIGSIQCWPVVLTADDGREHPIVMVGPVAVVPERQGDGVGRLLMERALAAADAAGPMVMGSMVTASGAMGAGAMGAGLMLIGDPGYYGRFFGFTADATGRWRLPGPVDRHRLLARGSGVPDVAGVLGPAVVAA